MKPRRCPQCQEEEREGVFCSQSFDQMLAWDFADFSGAGQVHHLTVLCYYLQHPRHYSPEALEKAKQILKQVIEKNLSDTDLYQEESKTFSSSQRSWKVTGTPTRHGTYASQIGWSMTAAEVIKDGVSDYPANVKQWARSIYDDLKKAGELKLD